MTLPTQAQIVVIGGGIIGCSTAYDATSDDDDLRLGGNVMAKSFRILTDNPKVPYRISSGFRLRKRRNRHRGP